jgi:activator of HSP90 ATPase
LIKTETIEFVFYLEANPEEVYDIFLDSKKHAEFTESDAEIDPSIGGKFTIMEGYITGKNLKLERGKKIVQEWKTSEWPKGYPPSTIDFSFIKKGVGTEVRFIQTAVPSSQADEYEKGWEQYYWTPLMKYLKKR